MSHRLLTAAAARLGAGASAPAIAASTPAPAATTAEGDIDVVSVADAQAAIATEVAAAEIRGATAERERTAAVFASDSGKANPTMAAWMLQHNAAAAADTIIATLGTMPVTAAAAPAAVAEPAPAAPAAITVPLTDTPKVDAGPAANNAGLGNTQAEIDKSWDTSISAAVGHVGAELAPGIPRTGH